MRLLPLAIIALLLSALVDSTHAATPDELAAQVEIRRTDYGVPHIKGDTLEAVAFGFGYCQAEDHLENIMHSYLRARGQLALHFGGEDNLRTDLENRRYRVYDRAVEDFHRLDPDFRSMLSGFAAGLNRYVEQQRAENPQSIPDWVPTVTAHDVAAHGLTGVMRFAFNRKNIIRDFLKSQHIEMAHTSAAIEEPDPELGSNMWAFASSRTTTGNAILMGNPHQGWKPVSTYYEAHLTVPGELDFYGSTFVGRPVLTTGWNRHLGWSHTVNYPDLEEIYALRLDSDRADHYLFDGASVPLTRDDVEVQIRIDSGDVETRNHTFWHSPLGPVIHRDAEHVFVIRSASYDEYRFYQQWLRLAQARNFHEYQQALAIAAIPMFNICYADREGNIYYLWNGTIPDLPHPRQTHEAVPAAGSDDVWTHFHPLHTLPQLLNPPGGYVQNCNSPPYFTNLHVPFDPVDFPAHFPANNVSLRSQHSLALIHNDQKLSLEDVVRLKHSPRMLLADRVKDDLIAAVRKSSPTSEVEAALALLADWDNTVAADSRGSTLFESWWTHYRSSIFSQDDFAEPWSADAPTQTPRGLSDPARAVTAFYRALDETRDHFGDVAVTWGDAHRIRHSNADGTHATDLPMSGGSGRMGCFRVAGFRRDDDDRLVVNTGDSWVFTVEFAETPRAYTIVGYSQSEIPGTPHYDDQAPLYSQSQLKPAAFTDEQIDAALTRRYRP